MTPIFSIIIPVYNVAPYLRDCLDSVLAAAERVVACSGSGEEVVVCSGRGDGSNIHSTTTNYNSSSVEIICVDDGSTDGSLEILKEYERNFHSSTSNFDFRVLHQPNAGVGSARNAALDVATGEWLMFVDGDDVLDACALKRIEEEISAEPDADVIRYGFYRFGDEDGGSEGQPRRLVDLSHEIPQEEMDGFALITWRNAMRRRKCGDLRFAFYVCGEDRIYTFECLQKMSRLVSIPDRLYGYRSRAHSYTTSVIRTYRGWEGELGYRMEFLRKAGESGKTIHYEGAAWWLTGYLANEFLQGFMGSATLTDGEKRRLYKRWTVALPALSSYRAFTRSQRLKFSFQKIAGAYCLVRFYYHLKLDVLLNLEIFGPDTFLRKLYLRIRAIVIFPCILLRLWQ